jgi:hypothetical protein
MRRAPLALPFLVVLAFLVAASGASAATLKVRDRAATGQLELSAVAGAKRTVVSVTGPLRARRWLQIAAVRCVEKRCRTLLAAGGSRRHVSPGRHQLSKRLRVRNAAAVRLELRAGRRVIGRKRLLPVPREVPDPDVPDPGPAALSVSTSPGLIPGYDPSIPDYTVRCADAGAVELQAAVPAGQTMTVDGGPERTATTFAQSIALEPNQAFRFTVGDGTTTREHVVRCLPADFPSWTVERNAEPDSDWLAFTPRTTGTGEYAIIADSHGIPVWWNQPPGGGAAATDLKVLPDGTLAWARAVASPFNATSYDHVTLDGQFLGSISTVGVGADHHDLQVLPNGNYLLVAFPPRYNVDLTPEGGPSDATVVDGEIQEVEPDGDLVWAWNTKDHIDRAEWASWGVLNTLINSQYGPVYNPAHVNSLEVDGVDGEGVIFSARHLNAIYRINRFTDEIDWKLGGTTTSRSLTIVGDTRFANSSFGGQHDARRLSDGTVSVFDNGTGRNRAPRSVRYRINPATKTATLVEELEDPRAPVSVCCNSSRRLPTGRWVVTNETSRTISELTPSGEAILRLQFSAGSTYRAIPYSEDVLQRGALRAGMDTMHPR